MELTKEKLTDALSLTRERVRVWVSENLSFQKLDTTQQKDRHPLPPLSDRKMGEGVSQSLARQSYARGFQAASNFSTVSILRTGERAVTRPDPRLRFRAQPPASRPTRT